MDDNDKAAEAADQALVAADEAVQAAEAEGTEEAQVPEVLGRVPALVAAVIRTVVPYIVGALLALLVRVLTPYGVEVPEAVAPWLTEVLVLAFGTAYYVAARWLEGHLPAFPWLGSKAKPVLYAKRAADVGAESVPGTLR